jgi:hypothetical protein
MSSLTKAIEESITLSEITKKNYLNKASLLTKLIGKPLEYIIAHPKPAIKKIKTVYSNIGSRKTFYTFILAVFRYNPELNLKHKNSYDIWFKEFTESDEIISDKYKNNEPSEKQELGYVKFEDIVKKRDELEVGSTNHLLLSFYTYIPPMRSDYGRIRLYDSATEITEQNYILMGKTPMLVLKTFKTAKHREKEYNHILPKEIVATLEKNLSLFPREWLFVNNNGTPYIKNSYTQWSGRVLRQLFNKPLTVSLIRHAYINALDFNKLTIKEKEKIAENMGHTVATQDKYRIIL